MVSLLLTSALAVLPTPVRLDVDATDADRGIFHVKEEIASGGPITLKYPKWIPGEHAPSGPVFDVVNIHFRQSGRELEWHHDPLDLYAIQVTASPGPLEASFDYVAPRHSIGSRNLARIKWNRLIFLPPSNATTMVTPTLRVPEGWSVATALDFDHTGTLETVSAERLIDSPAVIGRYYHSYRIDSAGQPPAALEVFTEKPAELPDAALEGHRRLYKEAIAFFGYPHFRHYQFLLTFSNEGGGDGLEHNECSEDGEQFDVMKNSAALSDLDAHEFSHSWCGKFRRPIGLATLNYDAPMNDQDLWVYEGFTQFAGVVLSARSGMWTPELFRERIAIDVDSEENRAGRSWRTVEDTAIFGSLINTNPDAWLSRRRVSDYYTEMVSVWLEADGIIRRLSGGKKSIDDFCHIFFGGRNAGPQIVPYGRQDVIAALNAAQPYDWKGFLKSRVFTVRPHLNDGWLDGEGWTLTYDDEANKFDIATQIGDAKDLDLTNSMGISVSDGEIRDVQELSPADQAKLAPGMKLIAVDGVKFTLDVLKEAIQHHVKDPAPIGLTIDDYDVVRTVSVDYHGGLKIPHLKRLADHPDLLSAVGEAK